MKTGRALWTYGIDGEAQYPTLKATYIYWWHKGEKESDYSLYQIWADANQQETRETVERITSNIYHTVRDKL